jgi:hypothetical protein
MESAFGKGVVHHPLRGKDPRRFELLEGGRELALLLKDTLVFGQSFAFLSSEWSQIPLIQSILHSAGHPHTPARVLPLRGDGNLLLPGLRAQQRPLLRKGMFSVWTDRETYRAEQEWVRIFVFAPHLAGQTRELLLLQGEQPVGGQTVELDEFGIGTLQIQGLPIGEYRLFCPDEGISNRFVVATFQRPLLESRWVQQYIRQTPQIQQSMLVFVLQLSSFGAPFQGDVGINLLREVQGQFQPVVGDIFRADGVGRIAGELPLPEEGSFMLEVQSLQDPEKRTFLSVTADQEEALQDILNPLGRLLSWTWQPEEGGAWGMRLQETGEELETPLVVEAQQGSQLWLRCTEPMTDLVVQILDPLRGFSHSEPFVQVDVGQVLEFSVPQPSAVVLLGAFVDGQPWEGWTATLPQSGHSLQIHAPLESKPNQPLSLQLTSSSPELCPVYVMVTEEQDTPRTIWGPAATLQGALKEVLEGLRVGTQRENYRVVDIRASEERPSGRPGTIPAPSSPPPASPNDTQEIVAWEPPPLTAESFPKLLFAGLVPVEGTHSFEIWPGEESTTLRVDAVLLDAESPAYASTLVEVGDEHFLELLAPEMVSEQFPTTGEWVVATRAEAAYLTIEWNGQPLSLWRGDELVDVTTTLQAGVHPLRCQLRPGQYKASLRSAEGTVLATLERSLERWGERREAGLQLQLHHQPEAEGQEEILYALQLVVANLIQRPAGNCENEAARVLAGVVLGHWMTDPASQQQASLSIAQGMERLQAMMTNRGLCLLPGGGLDRERAQEAMEHLQEALLYSGENPESAPWSAPLQQLLDEILRTTQLPRLPQRIQSCRDAFRVFHLDQVEARRQEAVWELDKRLTQRGSTVRVQVPGRMQSRQQSAYAAAILLPSEDERLREMGWMAAQTLLRRFKPQSPSLSSLEAISLLHLFHTLLKHAQALGGRFVLEESPWVQDLRIFAEPVEWKVGMHRPSAHQEPLKEGLEVGERVVLQVQLQGEAEVGDLLEVYLPPELLWPEAEEEEEILRFPVPESGLVQLPLVASAPTEGVHGEVINVPWGVRLTNPYREERGHASFEHSVRIWPHGERKRHQGRWKNPFRQLFG